MCSYYSDRATGCSTIGVAGGDGKGGVGASTTPLTSQKVGFCICGGDFCHQLVSKTRS